MAIWRKRSLKPVARLSGAIAVGAGYKAISIMKAAMAAGIELFSLHLRLYPAGGGMARKRRLAWAGGSVM